MKKELSTAKPIPLALVQPILDDCNNVLHNIFEISSIASSNYDDIIKMCNEGASEKEVYEYLTAVCLAETLTWDE